MNAKSLWKVFAGAFALSFAALVCGGEPGGRVVSGWLPGPTPQWHIRMDTALRAARRENKKIFILQTGSDWCSSCMKLYRDVLARPEFTDFARRNLVLVYLDFPQGKPMSEYQKLYNKEVARSLRILGGSPSSFIFDGAGRRLGVISGYVPLEEYMPTLRAIFQSRAPKPRTGLRAAAFPAWLRQSPEELRPMLERLLRKKRQAAARAAEACAKAKALISFTVVAWGVAKDRIDRPFDPRQEIRVPVGTRVYFRVRHRAPETLKAFIYVSMPSVSISSYVQAVSGNGEFDSMLCYKRPSRQDRIQMLMRLPMEESPIVTAAELPCRITWE